jgi:hypothetical protein
MATYSLSPKQLDKLKVQLHGKNNLQSQKTDPKHHKPYSIAHDLQKVVIITTIIIAGQLVLIRFI